MTSLSFVAYAGDGTTGPFSVPFSYLDKAHVAVSVDGVSVGFSWTTDSAVALAVAAAAGALVEIRRTTPREERLVDFTDGSVLLEADLDLGFLQQLYIAQEVVDAVENSVTLASDGTYAAKDRRISGLAAPEGPQDAATKAYVDAAAATDAPAYAAQAAASAAAAAASAEAAQLFDPEGYYTTTEVDGLLESLEISPASTEVAGVVEKSTSAENLGGTAADVFPDVAGVKEMIETHTPEGVTISVGTVIPFYGETAPVDFLALDGSEIDRSEYAELFEFATSTDAGSTTDSSTTVTGLADAGALRGGMAVEGDGIPAGTTIAAINSGSQITLSAPATATASGVTLRFYKVGFSEGDGVDTFDLPDFRGEFLRGWDGFRGVDPVAGRVLGSSQLDQFQNHAHYLRNGSGGTESLNSNDPVMGAQNQNGVTGVGIVLGPIENASAGTPRVGTETRPRNIAVLWCICSRGGVSLGGGGSGGSMTASQILTALRSVDGADSELDADTLDGNQAADFAAASHSHTLSDISDAGALAALDTVGSAAIDDAAVTNAKLATMAQATVKGRAAGAGSGAPVDLTAAQLRAILNVEDGAAGDMSGGEIRAALLDVDGVGSGLDADMLDGNHASAFAFATHSHSVGDIAGVLPVEKGGTGAGDEASARSALGLAIGADVQAHSTVLDATTAAFTTALASKLDGVEAGADVTDAANVAAAGAAMTGGAHHDGFSDYVADEHVDHSGVTLTAGDGLAGGGDITASRSFSVDIEGLSAASGFGSGDKLMVLEAGVGLRKIDYDDLPAGGGSGIGGSTGATDNALLRADGSGGASLQASGVTLADDDTLDMADNTLRRPTLLDYGETVNALGVLTGGTDAIDLSLGNVVTATVSAAEQSFTFSNPPASGVAGGFTLVLTNGGSQTVNFPAGLEWAGGDAPELTASGVDILSFFTTDGGATWRGFLAGKDMQ